MLKHRRDRLIDVAIEEPDTENLATGDHTRNIEYRTPNIESKGVVTSSLPALLESQFEAEKNSPLPLWQMCLAPKALHALLKSATGRIRHGELVAPPQCLVVRTLLRLVCDAAALHQIGTLPKIIPACAGIFFVLNRRHEDWDAP